MAEKLANDVLQYSGYLLEAGLLLFLICRERSRSLAGLTVYVGFLLGIDVIARPYALSYGLKSPEYQATYWLTDVALQLAAFLLVCSFFRRACAKEEKMWHFVRLLLVFVFILVFGISLISLSRNYTHLLTRFMIEFMQNLYFTCLVLTTLLYLLMQQQESVDEELGLLVCGFGIQFAGPAASFALRTLTPGQPFSEFLVKLVMPLSFLGMLLTWFYAVSRLPKAAAVRDAGASKVGEAAVSEA